jgi:dienelactone hydrolase
VVAGDIVNVNAVGTYTVTYNVSDSAGNAAIQVNRTVVVEISGLSAIEAESLINELWNTRKSVVAAEMRNEALDETYVYGDYSLRIKEHVYGNEPENGHSLWISMHGGGGTTAENNDGQWENQAVLYEPDEGIYVAPRGPTDTWNLWHQDHVDALFERMIASYITHRGVNPNRIYLMGYSAGGDGAYQLAPRMADRFAAASMMAGHPGDAQPDGLRNLPFAIFMGGLDSAYDRNTIAAEWKVKLASLQAIDSAGYDHQATIYPDKPHWMDGEDAVAVPWMALRTRNAWPKRVVWIQDDVPHPRFYWLEMDPSSAASRARVEAEVDGRLIRIATSDVDTLKLHLHDNLLDLDLPVTVEWNNEVVFQGMCQRSRESIELSLVTRDDPKIIASSVLTVQKPAADSTVPLLALVGPANITLHVGGNYTEAGATATDAVDGDLDSSVAIAGDSVDTNTAGTYNVTYNVSDSSGNPAIQVTRNVLIVDDNIPPVITLFGQSTVSISQWENYYDPGATATDDLDGDITRSLTTRNNVDRTTAGTYSVEYEVSDSSGNTAQLSRTVVVSEFQIVFDYEFDNGYFSANPDRKIALEYAADVWESIIQSPRTIAAGTTIEARSSMTETGISRWSYNVDVGFQIIVYAYDFQQEVDADGNPDPSTAKAVGGTLSTPNVGALYLNTNADQSNEWFFDTTPETINDIPSKTHYDFVETAIHEIGHILGILRGTQDPFIVVGDDGQDYFDGPAIRAVNGGQPLPLAKDSSHIDSSFNSADLVPMPGMDRLSMHGSNVIQGFRNLVTPLDAAMLDDMGYDINYDFIPKSAYGNPALVKQYQDSYKSTFIPDGSSTTPNGLWLFEYAYDADKAVAGYPLRYMPPSGSVGITAGLYREDHITVPKDGYLIVNHSLSAANSPGDDVTIYSLLMDVRVNSNSDWRSLFNSNYNASNDGELYIKGGTKIGMRGTYSDDVITLGQWHRVVFTYNANTSTAKVYIDGALATTHSSVSQSTYGLYSTESGSPLLLLFGDDDGDSDIIDLKAAALYGEELSESQVQQLGATTSRTFGF